MQEELERSQQLLLMREEEVRALASDADVC
jgi:hypothetical protein